MSLYNLELNQEEALSLAGSKGLLVSTDGAFNFNIYPFTVCPSLIPKINYTDGIMLVPILNKLAMKMSNDHELLQNSFENVKTSDKEFVLKLVGLLNYARNPSEKIQLSVNRYDFFPNAANHENAGSSERGLKLISINPTAADGATFSRLLGEVYSELYRLPLTADRAMDLVEVNNVPQNDADEKLAVAIVQTHGLFKHKYGTPDACVVMVIGKRSQFRCEEDTIRRKMWSNHAVGCVRMTLEDITQFGRLKEDGHLEIRGFRNLGNFVISVAYLRSGNSPRDYNYETDWYGRQLLEQSTAVSCPTVAMQLVGLHKALEVLGNEGILEKFLSAEETQKVRSILIRRWDWLDPRNDHMAFRDPEHFSIVALRSDMGAKLLHDCVVLAALALGERDRLNYTVMERIHTPIRESTVLAQGRAWTMEMFSELGFFGVMIVMDDVVVSNEYVGYAMKSKMNTDDLGRFGNPSAVALDCPLLTED